MRGLQIILLAPLRFWYAPDNHIVVGFAQVVVFFRHFLCLGAVCAIDREIWGIWLKKMLLFLIFGSSVMCWFSARFHLRLSSDDCWVLGQQSVKAFHEIRCSNQVISWRRLFPINLWWTRNSWFPIKLETVIFIFNNRTCFFLSSFQQDDDDCKWSIKSTEATSKDDSWDWPAVDISITSLLFLSSWRCYFVQYVMLQVRTFMLAVFFFKLMSHCIVGCTIVTMIV